MNPMESTTRRRKNSSGDKFSFPSIIPIPTTQDSDQFEFGCVTPGSPNSPADHLFSNGRLLPHPFPVLQPPANLHSFTRSTSRTSSVSSKDSLMSSRCNSTSSRSSNSSGSCSTTTSARTSISTDAAEKKSAVPLDQAKFGGKVGGSKCHEKSGQGVLGKKQVLYVNGSSRRWGLIPAAPVVSHQVPRRRKGGEIVVKKKVKVRRGGGMGFGRRFLRWFVTACKECHAIKPLRGADVNMELQ
ncbi:uncharacterized protein LOC131331581 [Rhododendron vialii]|uniref:uncharacterized protein LOC131331581 n=1 Tax=Rhododendron vialii TaxID=182163 RepID=UPI00265E7081|nr:uncharacterized protein LOC131331581 [Rhododendron vialii]